MNIIKKLIKYNFIPDANKPEYIVIHDTDNRDAGANSEMHYRYFNSGDRSASAHFIVDDGQILQLVEIKDMAWHCGDGHGARGIGNGNSIGIEICINSDSDYSKAITNTVELVADLMRQYNISIEKVARHYDVSGKNCPQSMHNNGDWIAWTWFKRQIVERSKNMDPKTYQEIYDVLNKEGVVLHETRFDEPIKRGEMMAIVWQLMKWAIKTFCKIK